MFDKFNLSPIQLKCLNDFKKLKRINIWCGSVRAGKTFISLIIWALFVYIAPKGVKFLMVGHTRETIITNCVHVLQQIFGNNVKLVKGDNRVVLFGKDILLKGASDSRSEHKIRGGTFYGVYVDEGTLVNKEFFNMLLSRMSQVGAKMFATTNPDSPFHYLKTDFIDRRKELDVQYYHFLLEDNIALSKDYINNIKKEYIGLFYKRFILGDWVQAEGVVYDMFDENIHVVDIDLKETKFTNYSVSVDYGVNNPFTIGLYGWNKKPPVYLLNEYRYDGSKNKQKTDDEYAQDFLNFINNYSILNCFVDPSALSFITALRRKGIRVSKTKNDVIIGIRHASNFFHRREFFINRICKPSIREYCSYVWDKKAQERGEDKPLKKNDHGPDRDRYLLFNQFPPIQPRKPRMMHLDRGI